jgi:hypothetical protein
MRTLFDALLPALPTARLGVAAPFFPASLKTFREGGDAPSRRAAADLLLALGVFSAFPHFIATAPAPLPRVEAWEDPAAFQRFRQARAAAWRARDQVLAYTDALSRALEPVEQRAFGLELWALEKNRAAYETGELAAADYVRRLLDKSDALGLAPTAATLQSRRLTELIALEDGMDWRLVREERDGLIEALFNRASARKRNLLLHAAESLGAGRMSPARHGALLLEEEREMAGGDAALPFRRFVRYAELAESLDFSSLREEIRRMETALFGPGRNTPVQCALLELARDVRALRRAAAAAEDDPASAPDGRAEAWETWRKLPADAEALARTVELTTPRPAFAWAPALDALRSAEMALAERGPLLAENALKNGRDGETLLLAAPALLVPAAAAAFRKKGLRVVLLRSLGEPTGLPPAATALARAWGQHRLRWDDPDGPGASRSADALAGELLLLMKSAKGPSGETAPAAPDPFQRRLRIRLRADVLQRQARGGLVRISARGEGLSAVSLLWRWSADAGPAPRGFQDAGSVGDWRLSFRVEAGLKGPLRWAAAQAHAVRTATRRFFEMQKRATLLTGAWMAGGVFLSVFAGAVSVAFLVAWLAVGIGVLVGVVFFGREAPDRGEWSENFKSMRQKKKAFMERLFSSRPAEDR